MGKVKISSVAINGSGRHGTELWEVGEFVTYIVLKRHEESFFLIKGSERRRGLQEKYKGEM